MIASKRRPTKPEPHSRKRHALLFAAPWLAGLVILSIGPMFASLILSFTRWDGLSFSDGIEWVGTANYHELDDEFTKSLTNSLVYSALAVPLGLIVSLALALLANARLRGIRIFRTILMLPYMLGGVATIMIAGWIFNPRFGLMNRCMNLAYAVLDPVVRIVNTTGTTDWPTPDWLYSPTACKPALVLLHLWLGGGSMLVFLAALQRIPRSLHEAARLDGAGTASRFRHVTLVHLSPAILFNLIVGWVFAMQAFDQSYLLYNRSQRDGLLFYMLNVYRTAFDAPYRMGYAAALCWILFCILAITAGSLFVFTRKRIYYVSQSQHAPIY